MRRRWLVLLLLALTSCAARHTALPTPFPTLQSTDEFLALLTPSPSPLPSASVSPSPAAVAPATTARSAPAATQAAAPRQTAAAGRVHCPSGRVSAEVDDVSSDDGEPSPDGDPRWEVSISGTASNGTSAAVRSVHLVVTVRASNSRASSRDVTVAQTIAPGGTVPWSTSFRYRGRESPSDASVSVAGWTWANSSLSSCPR